MDDLLKWVLMAAGGLVVVALVAGVGAAIISSIDPDSGEPFDPYARLDVSPGEVPAYDVLDTGMSCSTDACSIELLVPDANQTDARAAIADVMADRTDTRYLAVQVVDDPGAAAVVCRMRYAADEETARVQMGETSDSYPLVEINCL